MGEKRPKVGIGVLINKNGKILLGKRINAHGEGTWSPPGGHLEFGETPLDCAKREVAEECGVIASNWRKGPYTNDIFEIESAHYVTLFVLANWESKEPSILEPDKCTQWKWFDIKDLPKNLFLPIKNLLNSGYSLFN
jgi:8-oxo-dGTP diphosphatase